MANDERLSLMVSVLIYFWKSEITSLDRIQVDYLCLQASNDSLLKDSPLVADAAVLNGFRYAKQAEYRHASRNSCLKGTRGAILDKIELWTRDFEEAPVYWLNGLAGTGKSTIAQTVAERMFADGRLGASFFCSRDFEHRRNLHFIFPTLAVQLARRYPEFRSIFVPLARSDPEVAHESLYGQMNRLIVRPLVQSSISTVIVIDALDECKDEEPASAILSVLGRLVAEVPLVKFFVTGRPESRIRKGFRLPLLAKATDVFVLHDVEPSQVNNDIQLFFRQSFKELKDHRCDLDGWPTGEEQDVLCQRAAGLFVYAVATVRFIDQRNTNPKRQLDRLLQSPGSSALEGKTQFKGGATLDSLYTTILQEAFGDNEPENDRKVLSVLGAVILAANPLSPSTIATLLGFDVGDVVPLLSSVHSLLIFQEDDRDHPVRPFHKSFPDFIADQVRCANPRFCINPLPQHAELLVCCLELMNQRLERNMCGLPDAVLNSEVDDLGERIEQHIDQALQYACRSWHKHLINTILPQNHNILHNFLEKKFLFWLEVLSVLGTAREAVDAMGVARKWLNVCCLSFLVRFQSYSHLIQVSPTLKLVRDCFYFLTMFVEVINKSAPHIYHSALPLSPPTSSVHVLYKQYAQPFARVVQGLPTLQEAGIVTKRFTCAEHSEILWSPCSRFLIVGSDVECLQILDSTTLSKFDSLQLTKEFDGWKPALSQDNHLLAVFDDEKMAICDLQTGSPATTAPLELDPPRKAILSSMYSIDGNVVVFAYKSQGREDTFIVSYDLLSCKHTPPHALEGHFTGLTWAHGEHLQFATVRQGLITIWEVSFTLTNAPAEVESFPTPDEIIDGKNFLFLPDLSRLAFSLKNKILVWDAKASNLLLESEQTNVHKSSFSFSCDGRFFAYQTDDEVFIWKDFHVGYMLHQKVAFPGVFPCKTLCLSPDGESVILSTGYNLHLWSTNNQTIPYPGSQDCLMDSGPCDFILEISPNKTLAAFGSEQNDTVIVIDLQSSDWQLVINTDVQVYGLTVTETAVAIINWDGFTIWNIPAGNLTPGIHTMDTEDRTQIVEFGHLLPSYTGGLKDFSVSISPDLSHFALLDIFQREKAQHVRIYDMFNQRCLGMITTNNNCEQPSLRFSPDGCEIWIMELFGPNAQGWAIIKDGESIITKLEPLAPTVLPSGIFPSRPSHGYEINYEWVVDSAQKHLLWLPHHLSGPLRAAN